MECSKSETRAVDLPEDTEDTNIEGGVANLKVIIEKDATGGKVRTGNVKRGSIKSRSVTRRPGCRANNKN